MGQTCDQIGAISRRAGPPAKWLGRTLGFVAGALALGGCYVVPAGPPFVAAPAYAAPAPVYVAPAPVYVYGGYGWGWGWRHGYRRW